MVPESWVYVLKTTEASNKQGCESKQAEAWDDSKTFPLASLISTATNSSGTLARPLTLTGEDTFALSFGVIISIPKFTEAVSVPACGWRLGTAPFALESVEGKLEIGLGVGDGVG